MRRLVLFLTSVALGWAYMIAFAFAAGVAAAQLTPKWWLGSFPEATHAALIWLALVHVISLLLVSLPFAWIINRLYGRFGVVLACLVTATICATVEIPAMLEDFSTHRLPTQALLLLGVV